ncbi:hypothetical protein V8E51_013905 [Hyaloscypha variabilis]
MVEACWQAMVAGDVKEGGKGYSQRVPRRVTGLHLAAYFDLRGAMEALLGDGCEVDARDTDGKTPLSWAAEKGSEMAVRLLLEQEEVDPSSKDKDGRTPLFWAAGHGHEILVDILLRREGVEYDLQDAQRLTPLVWSARSGHAKVVKLLLKQGATFDSKGGFGITALRVAVESKHEEVTKLQASIHSLSEHGMVDGLDIEALLCGKWQGKYYYRYWPDNKGDLVSFTISVRQDPSRTDKLFVLGDGQDAYGNFTMHGDVRSNGEISFAKLYEQYGWIFAGQLLHTGSGPGTMFGWWGVHNQDIRGTFVFSRDLVDSTALEQASSRREYIGAPLEPPHEFIDDVCDSNQTTLQVPKTTSTTSKEIGHGLCEECSSIDFTQMGFQDQDSKARFVPNREVSLARLYEIAESCRFCRHVLDTFNSRARKEHSEQIQRKLDMEKSIVRISYDDFSSVASGSRLKYLTVRVDVASESTIVVKFYFQRGVSEPMTVAEICDRFPTFEWPQVEHGTARWRPLVADFRLFRKWNEFCHAFHDHQSCIPLARRAELRRLRLIDTHLRCLVEKSIDQRSGTWNISWVALSYVWGSANVNRLLTSNLHEFQKRDFFCPGSVPQTILDAIELAEGLGERYIWVDSCCILQDSDLDKREFVSRMDIVYGLASVTIVNAAGNHADHGLPGTGPTRRYNSQKPFHAKDVLVVDTLDPGKFGTNGIDSYLEGTAWESRGWTLQEGLLSQRLLIFTAEQAYWECPKATWCEDSHWETSVEPSENRVFQHIQLKYIEMKDFWVPEIKSFDKNYRHLVQMYSVRQLSFAGDYLNAFLGISNCLETVCGTGFIWGIPIKFLAGGLAWKRPAYMNNGSKTRPGKCKIQLSQRFCETPFPSWSWISCVGGHVFYMDLDYINGPDAGLIFHIINRDRKIEELPRNTEFRVEHAFTRDHTPARWRGARATVTTEDVPQSLIESDIAPALLIFYTSSAELDASVMASGKPALTYKGRNIETRWDQEPENLSVRPRLRIIITGLDNVRSWQDSESELRAFVVQEGDFGVLYRVGMITIREAEWDSIVERKWELVFLA